MPEATAAAAVESAETGDPAPSDDDAALIRLASHFQDHAWNTWNDVTTNCGTCSTSSSTTITLSSDSSATSGASVWLRWIESWSGSGTSLHWPGDSWSSARKVSPEDSARILREDRKRRAATRLANYKAERLLEGHLSNEQRQDLRRWGFFKLYVQKNGVQKVYRIRRGQVRNVDLLEETPAGILLPVKTLCLHPTEKVPDADAMLVQKFLLESNEDEFLRIANQMPPVAEALREPRELIRAAG